MQIVSIDVLRLRYADARDQLVAVESPSQSTHSFLRRGATEGIVAFVIEDHAVSEFHTVLLPNGEYSAWELAYLALK